MLLICMHNRNNEMEAMKGVINDEEKQATLEMWEYALGFTPTAVVKCAIQLQIAEVLEAHGGAMTHSDLSAAVGCSPTILNRVMRYLIHRRFFKQTRITVGKESLISYTHTPLSKLLIKNGGNSMAALVMLESSPVMLAPWQRLNSTALNINGASPFEVEHGTDVWEYSYRNPAHTTLINDAMACIARQSMTAIIDQYPEAFAGIASLVDVGGGNGTALRILVKACPWIRGINFDLPHVVSGNGNGAIECVAGNMFANIPKADAAFLMSVLHDWSDEDCIRILKKCREAVSSGAGKVIIVEVVIREGDDEKDKYSGVRLALDMVMLAHTHKGKERTFEEWEYVVKQAGFTRFTVKNIQAIISIIEAYP